MTMRINIFTLLLLLAFPLISRSQKNCATKAQLKSIFVENYKDKVFFMDIEKIADTLSYRKECLDSTFIYESRRFLRGLWDFKKIEASLIESNNYDSLSLSSYATKIISPQDTLKYKMVIDSLRKYLIKERVNKYRNRKIRTETILSIGKLYLHELMPDLRKCLENPQKYDIQSVKLALSRLGDTTFQKEIYAKYRPLIQHKNDYLGGKSLDKKAEILKYINTNESWAILFEELLNKDIFESWSGDGIINYKLMVTHLSKHIYPYFTLRGIDKHILEDIYKKNNNCDSSLNIEVLKECRIGRDIYDFLYEKIKENGFTLKE